MPSQPRKTAAKKAAPKKTTTTRATKAVPAKPSTPGPKVTGIAAKRAQVRGEDRTQLDPYAPTVWGGPNASGALEDLTLPSGQLVLAQRPGPEGLMAAGMLDDLDMLSTVLPKIGGRVKKGDLSAVAKNPQMLKQAMDLMNRVTVHVVIKPELTPEPADPREKERGKIYPSSVSMEDKTFIFNWAVGGTQNLTRFREELNESVAGVESVEVDEDPAE